MTIEVEVFDPMTASEDVLEGAHRAVVDMEKDYIPDSPAGPLEHHLAQWRAPSGTHRVDRRFVGIRNGEVVGLCHVAMWDDHEDSGLITISVQREHRRHGVGSSLLEAGLDALEEGGRSKLILDVKEGSPIEAAVAGLGLKKVFGEKISRVRVDEIDWALMDEWIERASDRAQEYELLYLQVPLPEEHLDNWSRIEEAMNTAPLEDFDLGEETMTPEKWRSIEASLLARATDFWATVAVHKPTGEFAGASGLMYQANFPQEAQQGDTVVHPDHRNRGLGRLVKAASAKNFLPKYPEVEWIDTGNAGSNDAMLKINVEMGFKPAVLVNAWQGEISAARAALAR